MNILGDNLKDIAKEKAGIIKNGVPVILYPQEKEAEEVILKTAEEKNSKVHFVKRENGKLIDINYEELYQKVQIEGCKNTYTINLPLLGAHQVINLGVALNTIEALFEIENIPLDKNIVEKSLEDVKWIGRLEVLGRKPTIVIDGAHNIDAIKALKKAGLDDGSDTSLELAEFIVGDDEAAIDSKVKCFSALINKMVASEVDKIFKTNGGKP